MSVHIKPAILRAIARVHLSFFQKELPDTLAVYFHELEPWQAAKLDEALIFFADLGYRTVHARDFVSPGAKGDKRLFLSFDDNFRGWHRALPMLARHDARCTFYVNTAPIRDIADAATVEGFFARIRYEGDDTTLSLSEIRDLHAAGHVIGCHTHSHPMLSRLPRERWDDEILRCKRELEELTGAPVRDFSFPFGMKRHFSAGLRRYCADIGFATIATGISGLQHVAQRDPMNLHRTAWHFGMSLQENLARLRVHSPLYGGVMGRCAVGGAG